MPEHQQIQQSKKPDTIFQKQATPVIQTPASNPYSIIQRVRINPKSLTHADIMQLQRTIGNRAVGRLLSSIGNTSTDQQSPVQRQETPEEETCPSCMQRQEIPEEEEPLQGKFGSKPEMVCPSCFAAPIVQRQEIPEEEEPLQGKMIDTFQRQEIPEEEEPLQGKFAKTVQRQEIPEEEEPVQGKMIGTIQRQEIPEEEEPLQGKMIEPIQRQEIPEEEEPLQGRMADTIQRQEIPEEEESLQGKMIGTIQRQEIPEEEEPLQGKMAETVQLQEIPEEESLQTKTENNTGMPDNLKAGVESLSGIDMNDVRVHYNSGKPAEIGALAYTQGTDIHVASGQEKHLPHEAWHVVQQAQGRVQPTMQLKDGVQVNDDKGLEQEADVMGVKAFTTGQDMSLWQGAYEPGSRGGKELIAHELTHVVKQNGGAVMRREVIQRDERDRPPADLKVSDQPRRANLIGIIKKDVSGFLGPDLTNHYKGMVKENQMTPEQEKSEELKLTEQRKNNHKDLKKNDVISVLEPLDAIPLNEYNVKFQEEYLFVSKDAVNVSDEPELKSLGKGVNLYNQTGKASPDDVKQQALGDCYFLAALASIASQKPQYISDMISRYNDDTYAVRFFNKKKGNPPSFTPEWVRVDNKVYMNSKNEHIYAEAKNAIWPAIVEKAYAVWKGKRDGYESIVGGHSSDAFEQVMGQEAISQEINKGEVKENLALGSKQYSEPALDVFKKIRETLARNGVVAFSTNIWGSGGTGVSGGENMIKVPGLASRHAYSILGTKGTIGQDALYVTVRNPWGRFGRKYQEKRKLLLGPKYIEASEQESGTFDLQLSDLMSYARQIHYS